MGKAVVVGSINMDIVAFVQRHPKVGETVFGDKVEYFPGGKGSNQAVSCKRLGCKSVMVGRVGDDVFGEQMLKFQQNEGIDTHCVKKLKGVATGTAFITVSKDSENSIIVLSGANSIWDETFLDEIVFERDDVVLAQFEVPDDVIIKSFQKAKQNGAATILNPAPIRPISRTLAELSDILVVNEVELSELLGSDVDINEDESVFNAAERLLKDGYGSVVVTLGAKGVCVVNNKVKDKIDSKPVKAVDTTGAGDTFIGALASGLLLGKNISKAAEFANIAASISVTREGAASSIPTINEVNKILEQRP